MESTHAFIGFGEAAMAFAGSGGVRGYDRKTDAAATRAVKRADFARHGIAACETAADALDGTDVILSLVTADQALLAATRAAEHLKCGALWLDLNSVSPDTKRAAAGAITAAGGRYVDVAVMAPVHPAGLAVSLLVSGPHAEPGRSALATIGFCNTRIVAGDIGAASAIKMIRSVMVKGLEALTTECFLAADAAGVTDEVAASLDASWPGTDWAAKADYNLDRMMVHGLRRAAEMEEVVMTLDALGTGATMTRGTVARQRAIGALGLSLTGGLHDKITAILAQTKERAA